MKQVAAHVVLFRNNKQEVLLCQRMDMPLWVLPGGQKEADESIEETAIREVKEETGLNIRVLHLIGVYTSPNGNINKHLFEGEVGSGELASSEETKDIKWYNTDNLPFNILRFEVSRISDAQGYSGHSIEKTFHINNGEELSYLSKKPFFMLKLIFSHLFSKITPR